MDRFEEIGLLEQFQSFLGGEKYRKFVRELASQKCESPDLVYWQRRTCEEFKERCPAFADAYASNPKLFLRCDCHGTGLKRLELTFSEFEVRDTHDIRTLRDDQFPFAIGYRQCTNCFFDWRAWLIENQNEASIWRRQIQLEQFFNNWMDGILVSGPFEKKTAELKEAILSKMRDGDEIWEFNTGIENLSGCVGLGIFRQGVLIENFELFKA